MEFILGFIYMVVIGAVLVSMAVLLLKGKKELYNRIYLGCQGLVAVWCMSQILLLLAETQTEVVAAYVIGNLGICFVGAFWYYFAVVYTGGKPQGIAKYVPIGLSALHYVFVLTNGWHHLYYTKFNEDEVCHGIFFYTNVLVTYALVLLGAATLYRNLSKEQDENGAKGLIIASVLIPVFLNAVQLSGMITASFDITPLGFGISIICVFMATLKYRFLDLNRELEITNEKLILSRERNRIAQEVHDTAGHTLTMIQSYMKLARIANEQAQTEQVSEYLEQARELTGKGIKELRESINRLRQEESYELVTQGVMQLANQVKEMTVEVTVKGEDSERYSHLSRIVYDCVRESITNSLKYASAKKLEIVLRFDDNSVEVVIADDGKGCSEITDNNGLRGIRERVEGNGGSVRFISGEGEGFLTRIHLNLHKK
ncbi:MAG: sensor histidine kinase [Lachnospiraceae bacterium]|nr:sensor histidine kinase [Lachnospiraceae bacterium]